MSLGIPGVSVFSLRLKELPMPTGSRDSGVLLDWILDSMGLVRRSSGDEKGALHLIMMEAFLTHPLGGWDSKQLGDQTGLSNTGIHHQITKLRECGLVTAQVDGKWHRNILRGGSMSAATRLVESNATTVLGLRMSEVAQLVEPSETRMEVAAQDEEEPFSIRIAEPGPSGGDDAISILVHDLGLTGEGKRLVDDLARDLLSELCKSHHPITLLALSERTSESRGRVSTVLDRMRAAGLVERAPMMDRIPQDVYSGLVRQFDARGEGWLMTRGGLGRLDESVSKPLLEGVRKGTLDIEGVRVRLSPLPLEDQRILLNTLGGRMPYGYRMAGSDGTIVTTKVMRRAERTLRRLRTVAERLDEAVGN